MTKAEILVAIDNELLRKTKHVAGNRKQTKSELIEEAVRRELQRSTDELEDYNNINTELIS